MDSTSNAAASEKPTPTLMLSWPIAVQFALGIVLTAGLFFFLGRWSHAGWREPVPTPAVAEQCHAGIDLNRATKAELRLVPGIGDALAQRIVHYREEHGDFRSVDELRKVSGIGPKTLDRVRHCFFVVPAESPVSDDDEESSAERPMSRPRTAALSKKVGELKELINVNSASQAELQKLPGIGPKLSQRILDTRANAPFKTVDELRRVPGIGPKTLEKLRPFVKVG